MLNGRDEARLAAAIAAVRDHAAGEATVIDHAAGEATVIDHAADSTDPDAVADLVGRSDRDRPSTSTVHYTSK
ncbi:hypothetical protein GCM10008995_00800 [Halobellus salinus]|uniref:Uncharacterized protein n=1 Tax=Halobellus salinus TaxID=931585 RepID=A0A830E6Q9_9EURY|nr:hypothetical protein [Halobellus salinus]GGI94406.1 hypothetical protein GCM10008995_00800 [Halobellus salinus]